jgi:hypothetical protein
MMMMLHLICGRPQLQSRWNDSSQAVSRVSSSINSHHCQEDSSPTTFGLHSHDGMGYKSIRVTDDGEVKWQLHFCVTCTLLNYHINYIANIHATIPDCSMSWSCRTHTRIIGKILLILMKNNYIIYCERITDAICSINCKPQ